MKRVPVHVVLGAPGAGAADPVAGLLAERLAWRVLAPRACPCCVGRVELQVGLVRLLREERPERVLVRLPDPNHLATFQRVLEEWPLARHVRAGRAIRLPEDVGVGAEILERDTG